MIAHHYMTANSVFIVLLIGFALDWSSFGPDGWRDKLAWAFYAAGIREGFNGGAVDTWLVEQLSKVVQFAQGAGNTYIASAVPKNIVGGFVGVLILYTLLCLAPPWKWLVKKVGPAANITFPKGRVYRINWPILVTATAVGLMTDLVGGAVGYVGNNGLDGLSYVLGYIPGLLFG